MVPALPGGDLFGGLSLLVPFSTSCNQSIIFNFFTDSAVVPLFSPCGEKMAPESIADQIIFLLFNSIR